MTDPRRLTSRFFAALTTACLAAALPLTQAAAQDAPAKQASPNGKIVFQSTQGGDGFVNDVYVMDADGKHQTRLTDSPTADDASPIWSPQGDKIAFVSDRRGNGYEIYLMAADGSNQRPLRATSADVPLYGQGIEWSPDGTKLKFVSDGKIYVAEVVAPGGGDSTAPVLNLSAGAPAGAFDSAASWSPDGQRLALISTGTDGFPDLFVMNADGTDRTQLTFTHGFEANPRWSPVGSQVAYEASRGGARDIYVMNLNNPGTETKVSGTVEALGAASWSPDGTRLAFTSGAGNVYKVSPDGSGLTMLTDVPANGGGVVFWSPDGAKVAFHNSNGTSVDVYVVNADGSRRATNYTKTRRDDEFAYSWQKLAAQ